MSVRINTNASAINTHRHVVNNAKVQERNLEKLASGMKVNRGVDGPAHIQMVNRSDLKRPASNRQ